MSSHHRRMSLFLVFAITGFTLGCDDSAKNQPTLPDSDASDQQELSTTDTDTDTVPPQDLTEIPPQDLTEIPPQDLTDDAPEPWQDPPTTTLTFNPSDEVFLNPERGFYRYANLHTTRDFRYVRAAGSTLAHAYVRLDAYRSSDIPQGFLDDISAGLAAARHDGIKIILRFAYNFGPYPNSEPDTSLDWVLTHIAQLTPLLQDNADVIAVVQAGFIGAWGEWHTSTSGLLDAPNTKYTILETLLQALPTDRMVQLRYPKHKKDRYGDPLTPAQAFTATAAARIGHHNDCFLSGDLDVGTYPWGQDPEPWKDYLAQDTRFVPMGGETCEPYPPRSECPSALAEMARLNFSYINHDYHPDIVATWQAQGCYDAIARHIGYRFAIQSLRYPPHAPPGGHIPLAINLHNLGWASPFNPRPVYLVITAPSSQHYALLVPQSPTTDPRRWLPGQEIDLDLRIAVPQQAAPGDYQIALWLPDTAHSLSDDPRYAIRLANPDIWQAESGLNHLATIHLDPSAPGSVDPNRTEFALVVD